MAERASVRIVEVFDARRRMCSRRGPRKTQLKRWWGPGRFTTTSTTVDFRSGGRYELVLEPGAMRLVGEFREVSPPERLVYTWQWLSGVPDTREVTRYGGVPRLGR